MNVIQAQISDLIPYARNARTHSDEQLTQIAASIREFGFTNPVLIDERDGIIAGHGRVMAARKLGMETVPCIRLSHLTETQRKAYILVDNRLPLNAGWDEELLALELGELNEADFDLSLIGFTDDELDAYLSGQEIASEPEDDMSDLSDLITCPNCGEQFDKNNA